MPTVSRLIALSGTRARAALVASALLIASALAPVAAAQPSETADGVDRAEMIQRIGDLLNERYVFPDVAVKCAERLKQAFDSGAFDDIADPEALAEAITETLRSVSNDKHMRVRVSPRPEQPSAATERPNPARARTSPTARSRLTNHGFEQVERLEGNVGYIDMRYFSGDPQARATASAAMNFLANSDALIFDMRRNGGGNPDMIRYISSYLFDEPTHLNSLYWRAGDRTQEFWTLDDVPGPRMADVPVFVLTSSYTFSGAEEFSYNLQTQERATLLGEVTGGGANPGGTVSINDEFGIFIPTGRAINPITGTNWEGVGVTPDIEMAADEAFDAALEMAQEAAEQYRQRKQASLDAQWESFDAAWDDAMRTARDGDTQAAIDSLQAAFATMHDAGLLDEFTINDMGYRLLGRRQPALAIGVFEFNVERYPESANVYDSLAEAYMRDGQNEKAIEFYTRSLELDPGNENAEAMIAQLRDGE